MFRIISNIKKPLQNSNSFFILCLGFSIIESVNLNCEYKTEGWWFLGVVDYCFAKNQGYFITDQSNRYVYTINESEIANPSVKAIYIQDSTCFYLPFGLEKLFPNLEGIVIFNSRLKEIRREDFKDYKNLRLLGLDRNEIEFLEPNLFEFTPKLEAIRLIFNKIAHIDANVFNNFVGKLSYLYLSFNICEFENAYDDKSKANEIISEVQSGSCKDKYKLPPFYFKKCQNRKIIASDRVQTKLVFLSNDEPDHQNLQN